MCKYLYCAVIALLCSTACVEDDPDRDHETEIISTVELTFTPDNGSDPVVAMFSDPDGDGGMSGTADAIELAADTTYSLEIRLLNDLAEPVEDITEELHDEAEEHLFLITGDAVAGPASSSASALVVHAYADLESDYGDNLVGDDLPVGIRSIITPKMAGTGQLRVMLRHLPEFNGAAQKTAGLPAAAANGEALAGEVDVDVAFELTVVAP